MNDLPPGRHPENFGGAGTVITTHHDYCGYVFTIKYHAADPDCVVDFPDFPAIISSGGTLTEAFANACEALDLHLESLHKLGQRVPKPKHSLTMHSA
jgi:predicted RNase H-like HicB family nuclease